MTCNILC